MKKIIYLLIFIFILLASVTLAALNVNVDDDQPNTLGAGYTAKQCYWVYTHDPAKDDLSIVKITRLNGVTATTCYVQNASEAIMDSGSFVGDDCTVDSGILDVRTAYLCCVDSGGAPYNRYYKVPHAGFPTQSIDLTFTNSYENPSNISAVIYDIIAITTQNVSTPSAPPVISNLYDVTGGGTNKTSDTTPTINWTTDVSATCNVSKDNATWIGASTTGDTEHQGTLNSSEALSIGYPQNMTVNCSSAVGSSYATIQYNITDGTQPTVTLNEPVNGIIYTTGVNNSQVLNFTVTDNYFTTLDCNLTINNIVNQTNSSVANGTKTSWDNTSFGTGSYTWNVTCADGHDNIGSDQRTFTVTSSSCNPNEISILLNGVNSSRKYEFESTVNISAIGNGTESGGGGKCNITVCIDLDAPNYGMNYSCAIAETSFIYNITILRQNEFVDGSTSFDLEISTAYGLDQTDISLVNFTYDSPGYFFKNITLKANSTVINATINLSSFTNHCYQENASIGTSCGGLSGGVYLNQTGNECNGFLNAYDNDYSTYMQRSSGSVDCALRINYTKPGYAINATWQVKDDGSLVNLTMPDACFNAHNDKLELRAVSFGSASVVRWRCYNGTSFQTVRTSPVFKWEVYEEAIFWGIYPNNITIDIEQNRSYENFSEYNGTSLIYLNTTLLQNCVNACNNQTVGGCLCELNFTSATTGILQIGNPSETNTESLISTTNISYVNFSMDPRTDIEYVSLNITSSGTTDNIIIKEKPVRGTLVGSYLSDDEFSFESTYYSALNLSYTLKGKKSIYVNLSDNPINLSFKIWGFDIDVGNDLNYNEYFNETNDTRTDAMLVTAEGAEPMGKYDNFETNITSRWTKTNNNIDTIAQTTGLSDDYYHLKDTISNLKNIDDDGFIVNDGDSNFNFSNYERVDFDILSEIIASGGEADGSSSATNSIVLTDGTNEVLMRDMSFRTINCFVASTTTDHNNVSFRRQDADHYYVFVDGLLLNTIDLSDLSNTDQWYIKIKLKTNVGGKLCSISSEIKVYNILGSGLWLNKSSTGTEFDTFGTMRSGVIANTSVDNNYTAVTVNSKAFLIDNVTYEISATNGTSGWEDITSFINTQKYVFTTQGNQLAWRINVTGTNETSPIIYNLNVNVLSATSENITVDFGGDETTEFTFTGKLNSTTSPQNISINTTNLHKFNGTFTEVEISTGVAGQIQVDNLLINSSANPVVLNNSEFENCETCRIDFLFSGDNLTVDDLRVDFLGSWNYTALAHSVDYTINASHIINILYSKFNITMPYGINWYDIFPSSSTQNNVTPYGQTSTIPIWNVSSEAYEEGFDVYVRTNSSLNSCLNITRANQSNYDFVTDYTITLNNSYQKVIHNITPFDHKGIWDYWNLNSCSGLFYMPWSYFSAICTDCVFDEDYLDDFDYIAE